jgi:hypothetical protein
LAGFFFFGAVVAVATTGGSGTGTGTGTGTGSTATESATFFDLLREAEGIYTEYKKSEKQTISLSYINN